MSARHAPASHKREFISGLDLPAPPPLRRGISPDAAPAPDFSADKQAIAIGAQLAEFTTKLAPVTRAAVSDSLLIAQLAANKAADSAADVFAWYKKYIEVLQGIGWQVRDLEFQTQDVADASADMHSAIIPVITAMLGPAVAATSLVLSVLNGLKEMDKDQPWITVFDRASQHAHGAKFQLALVDADGAGNPVITALCFGVDAERSVTQVLFFKFSQDSATLRKANGSFAIEASQLAESSASIADRVRPFVQNFIKNIDI